MKRKVRSRKSRRTGDTVTTVAALKAQVAQFISARDWEQFHAPKNIAMSIAIEAAELMEHFQWLTIAGSEAVKADPEMMRAIRHELADVAGYVFDMANALDIDLAGAVVEKLALNAQKYPVALCRGSAAKYTELHNKGRTVAPQQRSKSLKVPKVEKSEVGAASLFEYKAGTPADGWMIKDPGFSNEHKPSRSFEDLIIWRQARELVKCIYGDFKEGTPGTRDLAFAAHIKKTGISIKNNIAEGFERGSDGDFARFLFIAKGSCGEVRSMYHTAEDLRYVPSPIAGDRRNLARQISAGIQSLIMYLKKDA